MDIGHEHVVTTALLHPDGFCPFSGGPFLFWAFLCRSFCRMSSYIMVFRGAFWGGGNYLIDCV